MFRNNFKVGAVDMPPFDTLGERDTHPQSCDKCDLGDLAFCAGLGPEESARLTSILSQNIANPHDTIFREGDPALHLYSIASGNVKLYKLMPDGRRQITAFLFAGDFFGLGRDDGYVYTAEAVTPVILCRFPRKKLDALMAEVPKLEQKLLDLAITELAAAQEQMLLLGRKTAREKVATFLVVLADRMTHKVGANQSVTLTLPMGRADMADYLGLTIETISRTLTQLKRDGIINLPDNGHVVLPDPARLRDMAEGGG